MGSVERAARLMGIALSDFAFVVDQRLLVSGLIQAAAQSPNPQGWQEWFVVACPAAGLKCRSLTARREEIEELARAGGVIVVRQAEEWVAISAAGAIHVRSIDADGRCEEIGLWLNVYRSRV